MYSRILVALDGSATAFHALDAALDLAAHWAATLDTLFVVDTPIAVLDIPAYDPALYRDAAREEARRCRDAAAQRMAARQVDGNRRVVEAVPLGEDVASVIAEAARSWPADLLVMGTHGRRGWRRAMLGSVAERTVRLAACPVLLIPARMPAPA